MAGCARGFSLATGPAPRFAALLAVAAPAAATKATANVKTPKRQNAETDLRRLGVSAFRRFGVWNGQSLFLLCAICGICGLALPAAANINLELRPATQVATVGSPIDLGLYAVSDNPFNQLLSAAQVIIGWDITYVQLLGLNNAGAAPLLVSSFGAEPYGLNTSLLDGDAMWIGLAPLGSPVAAVPGGILLTTFRFQALAPTNLFTLIDILPTAGNPPGNTVVFDGTIPNTNVTGTLTGAVIQIVVPAPPVGGALVLFFLAGSRRTRVRTE